LNGIAQDKMLGLRPEQRLRLGEPAVALDVATAEILWCGS
jgi:hypothetical protein